MFFMFFLISKSMFFTTMIVSDDRAFLYAKYCVRYMRMATRIQLRTVASFSVNINDQETTTDELSYSYATTRQNARIKYA